MFSDQGDYFMVLKKASFVELFSFKSSVVSSFENFLRVFCDVSWGSGLSAASVGLSRRW